MKTKEEIIFVCVDGDEMLSSWSRRESENYPFRARITIEFPGRKVEISEGQFEEAFKHAVNNHYGQSKIMDVMKEKLFGKSGQ